MPVVRQSSGRRLRSKSAKAPRGKHGTAILTRKGVSMKSLGVPLPLAADSAMRDPSKPGMFVQVTKRGPNVWGQPHSHPNERFITVLAGTFYIGTGPKLDKDNTIAIGPGGVVHDTPIRCTTTEPGPREPLSSSLPWVRRRGTKTLFTG